LFVCKFATAGFCFGALHIYDSIGELDPVVLEVDCVLVFEVDTVFKVFFKFIVLVIGFACIGLV